MCISSKHLTDYDVLSHFQSVKNHMNVDISHPITDRKVENYYDMDLYDRNRLANPNLKYANSPSNY